MYPVLLGSRKRLFTDGTIPTALRLIDSATFGAGTVLLTYERVGKPTYGKHGLGREPERLTVGGSDNRRCALKVWR